MFGGEAAPVAGYLGGMVSHPDFDRFHSVHQTQCTAPQEYGLESKAAIPQAASQILSTMQGKGGASVLLPRKAEVDQMVKVLCGNRKDRNLDPRVVNPHKDSVVLSGMGGMGKTTLAAILVSREVVLRYFADGIGWIYLGHRDDVADGAKSTGTTRFFKQKDRSSRSESKNKHGMSYRTYRCHLEALCRQLDVMPLPEFEELVLLPGDDEAARSEKTRTVMQSMRQDMTNILGSKRVLIVLDDVWHPDDIELFSFANRPNGKCRVLVTTRTKPPRNHMRSVDMVALEEQEAVDLFLRESNLARRRGSSQLPNRQQEEAWRVVRGCNCHPMAVRSAGRLLAYALANGHMGLPELAESIEVHGMLAMANEKALLQVLGRSFSDVVHGAVLSRVLKRCFSSFAAVFTREDCLRPWIPFRFIHLLWNGILTDEECRAVVCPGENSTARILGTMVELGVLDTITTETFESSRKTFHYRIHHDMLHQLGVENLLAWDSGTSTFPSKLIKRGVVSFWHGRMSEAELLEKLNLHFVQNYFKQQQKGDAASCAFCCNWRKSELDGEYTFGYLPHHMLKANLPEIAEETLSNKDFADCRLCMLGILSGTEAHIADVEMLHRVLDRNLIKGPKRTDVDKRKRVATDKCFDAITFHLHERLADPDACEEVGEAFFSMGKALQRQSQCLDSLDMFAEALDSFRRATHGEDEHMVGVIREHIAASSVQQLTLVPRDSAYCVRLKYAGALRSMQEAKGKEGQRTTEREEQESVSLELISHHGLGIVPHSNKFRQTGFASMLDLGVGREEGALWVKWDGKRLVRASDSSILATPATIGEGYPIFLFAKVRFPSLVFSDFVVNEDGTVSPRSEPRLAWGLGLPTVLLVRRDSPARLIFKHAEDLKQCTVEDGGSETLSEEKNVFSTELRSHPGKAVVKLNHLDLGSFSLGSLAIGSRTDALQIAYDGRLLADSRSGYVVTVFLSRYDIGRRLLLYWTNRKLDRTFSGGGRDFVINNDGSISPMHRPDMAIGAACLGVTNEILSLDDIKCAQREAEVSPPPIPRRILRKEKLMFLRGIFALRLTKST